MLMSKNNVAAKLHYMASGFRMLSRGEYVLCAVSGERIEIENLRYWSAARQEAYASAEYATRALSPKI
jgi:hypothetical protein